MNDRISPVSVDVTNHHNALLCPYCNPKGLKFAEPPAALDEAARTSNAWSASTHDEIIKRLMAG